MQMFRRGFSELHDHNHKPPALIPLRMMGWSVTRLIDVHISSNRRYGASCVTGHFSSYLPLKGGLS
jgi:hypothetical protein